MLTIDNILYKIDGNQIFKNLGFSLGLGAALLVVGGNGVGKSTLLKIITTALQPASGKISWNNINIKNIEQDYCNDILYLGDKNFFKSELSISENLNFWAKLFGEPTLIPSAIKYFNLEESLHKKIKTLSSGWKQRAFLSQLLFRPATIWILDEVNKDLDLKGKKLLFDLLSVKIKQGGIVIFATHDEMFFPLGGNGGKLNIEDFKNNA